MKPHEIIAEIERVKHVMAMHAPDASMKRWAFLATSEEFRELTEYLRQFQTTTYWPPPDYSIPMKHITLHGVEVLNYYPFDPDLPDVKA
jgi:hypothetical protein